jgi:hypothetical protein
MEVADRQPGLLDQPNEVAFGAVNLASGKGGNGYE